MPFPNHSQTCKTLKRRIKSSSRNKNVFKEFKSYSKKITDYCCISSYNAVFKVITRIMVTFIANLQPMCIFTCSLSCKNKLKHIKPRSSAVLDLVRCPHTKVHPALFWNLLVVHSQTFPYYQKSFSVAIPLSIKKILFKYYIFKLYPSILVFHVH